MDIFIHKDGQQLGPFSQATLQGQIAAGTLSLNDHCWHQGLDDWKPADVVLKAFNEKTPPKILPKGQAYLLCISGPDQGKRVVLPEDTTIIIGRAAKCNVLSDDPDVAEEHVKMTNHQRSVALETSSEAAVFIDGQPAQKSALSAKQQVRIGRSVWQIEVPRDFKTSAGAMIGSMADRISNAAGLEQLQDFRARNLFAAAFKKRTDEDFENHFAVGTAATTPSLDQVDTRWPQPWAFLKLLLLSLGILAGLYYTCFHFVVPILLPGIIMVGAVAVPLSILVLFFEFNVIRNVSLYQVTKLVLFGGMLSLLVTSFFFSWSDSLGLSWLGASVAGIVEEPGKLAALLTMAWKPRYRWTLNGLLLGACVGTGFAVFETAGYAFMTLLSETKDPLDAMNVTLILRGLLTVFGGHGIWTAMVGAALWRVKGNQPFDFGMLGNPKFTRVFLTAVVLHAIWNSPLEIPILGLFGKFIALGFVAWVIVLSLVQTGLKEVREAQAGVVRDKTDETTGRQRSQDLPEYATPPEELTEEQIHEQLLSPSE